MAKGKKTFQSENSPPDWRAFVEAAKKTSAPSWASLMLRCGERVRHFEEQAVDDPMVAELVNVNTLAQFAISMVISLAVAEKPVSEKVYAAIEEMQEAHEKRRHKEASRN